MPALLFSPSPPSPPLPTSMPGALAATAAAAAAAASSSLEIFSFTKASTEARRLGMARKSSGEMPLVWQSGHTWPELNKSTRMRAEQTLRKKERKRAITD
jgi:hypothetical protein